MKTLFLMVVLALAAWLVFGSHEQPAQDRAPSHVAAPVDTHWRYSALIDEVSGKPMPAASVQSQNTIELKFPYDQPQRARLVLRNHPRFGHQAMILLDRGQFLCGAGGCSVSVRFDDGPVRQMRAEMPADYDASLLFLTDYATLVSRAKRGKVAHIAPTVYQSGQIDLRFDVSGLDMARLNPPKK